MRAPVSFSSPASAAANSRGTANCRSSAGLTLVEVVVILAALALLVAMVLPVILHRAKMGSGPGCMGNLRMLMLAWTSYASDNGDSLVPTGGLLDTAETINSPNLTNGNWVHGRMDRPAGQTNTMLIESGQLFLYGRNLWAYKCPADKKADSHNAPTVRSVAMNCWLNPLHSWNASSGLPPVKNLLKISDMDINPPANTWAMIDQSPEDIDDGWFVVNVAKDATRLKWVDRPATYHNGAGGVAFADGHAEMRRWGGLKAPAGITSPPTVVTAADLQWLSSRTSVPAD